MVEAWVTYVWLLLVPGNTVKEKRISANNLYCREYNSTLINQL